MPRWRNPVHLKGQLTILVVILVGEEPAALDQHSAWMLEAVDPIDALFDPILPPRELRRMSVNCLPVVATLMPSRGDLLTMSKTAAK
jgi:hypothetical protein